MKTSSIVAVLIVLLAVLGGWYALGLPPMDKLQLGQTPIPEGVVCTADAMQCPDGSWVGRSGPNCEFVCPGTSGAAGINGSPNQGNMGGAAGEDPGLGDASTPPGIAPYNSGIRGTVMAGPTCPVERDPPDPKCADKPLSTTVAIFRKSDAVHAIAFVQSNKNGAFEVSLPPGEYVVGAGESTMPRCTQTPATVGPSTYTTIVVQCDTGIR